jgi:hypothetical protein
MVTIVICYKKGTGDILAINLASLARHTKDVPYKVDIVVARGDKDDGLAIVNACYPVSIHEVGVDSTHSSKMHGAMLDAHIPSIDSEYVMTLDSDCFPVVNGWLSNLIKMMEQGADVVGILHPWAPPPPDMNKKRIEWRVRSQHCWNNTHVACQMLRVSKLKELGAKYNAGDDTGLAIVAAANAKGLKIDGFKPTRCPKPIVGKLDPEFNRYQCIVFGDSMYHHGGWTRTSVGTDKPLFEDEVGWVAERVMKERGAEFLLEDNLSYKYKFDREEEVAKEKMDRLFGMKKDAK